MENWEKQEGLIPYLETWKGFRGMVLWIILSVLFYNTVIQTIFDGILHQIHMYYGISYKYLMPPWLSVYYYIGDPILRVVVALLAASIVKKVLNVVIEKQNARIEKKNAVILAKNLAEDGTYIGTNPNLSESAKLQLRLQKGKAELAKYEPFLKKKDLYHCFYHWKKRHAVVTGFLSLFLTEIPAYVIVFILTIPLNLICSAFGIEQTEMWGTVVIWIIDILTIVFSVLIGFASMPFAKKMQEKADRLQEEDDRNGYTEALNRVIGDVPARYRRQMLLSKLIRIIKKKQVTTVEEAIAIYERNLAIKKGIVAIIYVFVMFGIVNAVNNAFDEAERDSHAIANDIGRRMDESRAETQRIRDADRRERELRNRAGAAQEYANRSRANAAGLKGTNKYGEGLQWANQAQRNANKAWNDLNRFLKK